MVGFVLCRQVPSQGSAPLTTPCLRAPSRPQVNDPQPLQVSVLDIKPTARVSRHATSLLSLVFSLQYFLMTQTGCDPSLLPTISAPEAQPETALAVQAIRCLCHRLRDCASFILNFSFFPLRNTYLGQLLFLIFRLNRTSHSQLLSFSAPRPIVASVTAVNVHWFPS